MAISISNLYFRRDSEYETTAYVTIEIEGDKLKLIFIINGNDCYITPEVEGSFIGRVKKFILNAYQIFQKNFPDTEKVCYREIDSVWQFIKLR